MMSSPPPPPLPPNDIPLPGVRLIGRPGQCTHLHWQIYSSIDVWPPDDNGHPPSGSSAEEWEALRRVQKAMTKQRKDKGTQMYSHLFRNGNRPSLAAFDANMGPHSTLDATIKAVLPHSAKQGTHCIQLSLILPCTEHDTPACNTCPTPFTSSRRIRTPGSVSGYESLLLVNPSTSVKAPFEGLWKSFTDAIVEEVARDEGWEGRRIAEGMLERKPKHSLSCTPSAQLLLSIAPTPIACSSPAISTALDIAAGTRCRLWPILQPAVFIQRVKIPDEVSDRLYDDFVEILADREWAGPGTGPRDVVWAAFWMPKSNLTGNTEDHLHRIDLHWNDQDDGRITWWPLCLVKTVQDLKTSTVPFKPQRPSRACLKSTAQVATDTASFIDGMLQLAQEEQDAERATQEEQSNLAQMHPGEGGTSVTMVRGDALSLLGEPLAQIDSRDSRRSGGTDSDSDDLFESTPTPPPPPNLALPVEHDQNSNGNDAPIAKDSVDAVSSAVQSPVGFGTTRNGSEYGTNMEMMNTDTMAMVTEDDFDFFDAPAGADDNEMVEKREGDKMQFDEGMMQDQVEERPQVVAMNWEEHYPILMPVEEILNTYPREEDQASDPRDMILGESDVGSPELPLPTSEVASLVASPPGFHDRAAPLWVAPPPANPSTTPIHSLVPDIFSAIPFEEHGVQIGRSWQRRGRFWPYGCRRHPTQAELAARRWNPRQALIDRLTAHEAARHRRLLTKTYKEPPMTFAFDSSIPDDATMTDTVSDTSNEEGETTDEEEDQGLMDALDPVHAECNGQDGLLLDTTTAISLREWLSGDTGSADKLTSFQSNRIRELLMDAPKQVEEALVDPPRYPDWLCEWFTVGLVETHGLGLQSWWTTWERESGYRGDGLSRLREMVKVSTLVDAVVDETDGNSVSFGQPSFHVAQSDSVISVAASALPHWLSLGLGPFGGQKEVISFVVYDEDAVCRADVVAWQQRLGKAFDAHHLGHLTLGVRNKASPILGVADGRWKEAMGGIILEAIEEDLEIVIFAVVATRGDQRRVETFNGLIEAYVSSLKTQVEEEDNIRLISRRVVLQVIEECDVRQPWKVGQQVIRLYDRLSRSSDRQAPRLLDRDNTPPIINDIRAPAFHLAKPALTRMSPYFAIRWPPPAKDLLDSHRIMHLAYTFSRGGRSIYVFSIDALGETWAVKRIPVRPGKYGVPAAIEGVWQFALRAMGGAAIEWRLAIARLGSPSLMELQFWTKLFEGVLERSPTPMHVSFFSYDHAPGSAGSSATTASSTDRQSGCVILPSRIAIRCPPEVFPALGYGNIYPLTTTIITSDSTAPMALHHLLVLSTSMSTLKQSDRTWVKTVAQDYHDLRSLGIHRWDLPMECPMPAHLAMVAMLSVSLSDETA